jgi:hypothetical protein
LRAVWYFGPQNHRWWVYGFRPQNPNGGSEQERTARGGIGESRRGEATGEEARWPSDQDEDRAGPLCP